MSTPASRFIDADQAESEYRRDRAAAAICAICHERILFASCDYEQGECILEAAAASFLARERHYSDRFADLRFSERGD
jgi:hypothetical protein